MRTIALIQTTLPSRETALALGRKVIACRLAACANLYPVESIYQWIGSLCEEQEFHLELKTSNNNRDELLKMVREEHPYEVPFMMQETVEVNSEYADWVDASTDQGST